MIKFKAAPISGYIILSLWAEKLKILNWVDRIALMSIVDNLIRHARRKNYTVEKSLSKYEFMLIFWTKVFFVCRFFFVKLIFKKSIGLLFVGRRCKIIFHHKISVVRSVQRNNVEINALSKSRIIIGNNVSILKNTIIECACVIRDLGEGLVIGNNAGIAQNCFIQVGRDLAIGNDVMFGPNVSIFSESHDFGDPDLPVFVQGKAKRSEYRRLSKDED